jgi:membrane-bound lytic murein transglycosylase B
MQFLPSTWAAVAVDGDDDGQRDVQDIDDASQASAV